MMRETEVAIAAAKAAGKIAMRYFGGKIKVETKDDGTPVTVVDRLCEKKIISIIKRDFPEHSVLSEESGEIKGNEYRWIIDPLDGTKEFIAGLPFFGMLIALEKKGKIILGVDYIPLFDILAFAEHGKGTYINGKQSHVSHTNKLGNSLIMYGSIKTFFKKGYNIMDIIKATRSKSISAIYSTILVAQGIADASIEATAKPWDLAAAKIIVEEAGGKVTDFSGKDTIYGGNSVESNLKIHTEILSMLEVEK